MSSDEVTIVLAKLKEDFRVISPGQSDIGIPAKIENILVPVAVMWLNSGNQNDLKKAKEYAEKEKFKVFTYPVTLSDPLQQAKKDVVSRYLEI